VGPCLRAIASSLTQAIRRYRSEAGPLFRCYRSVSEKKNPELFRPGYVEGRGRGHRRRLAQVGAALYEIGLRKSAPTSRLVPTNWSLECVMAKYKSPSKFPDEHMRLVGLIAAHWEWVEFTLERTVAEVMEHEYDRVGLLTENITFHALCDILMIYTRPAEKSRPDIWKECTAMLNELKHAYSLRNKYVHGK
jgi:hypothetical protein